MNLLTSDAFVQILTDAKVTDLVWIPDSALGEWNEAVLGTPSLRVIRPAREGEAIAIAAGLWIGGRRPLVAIQCTGLYEAGDALRNILFDLKIPLCLLIGIRSYFANERGGSDSAGTFALPIVQAWKLPYHLVTTAEEAERIGEHLQEAHARRQPLAILLGE